MDRVRLYCMRRALFVATLVTPLVMASNATDFQISSFAATGRISWTGASSNGVCSIEAAPAPTGPWLPQRNLFSTNHVGQTGNLVVDSAGNLLVTDRADNRVF